METNKIYNENCLDTMAKMPDDFVDLTVTSPPYDNLRDYKGYSFDFESIAKELYRVTRPGGVVVWVVGDMTVEGSETGTSFKQALFFKEVGFNLHDTMIYQKESPFPSSNRYQQVFEYMFVFSKGKVKTFNPLTERKICFNRNSKSSSYREKDGTLRKADEKQNERFKKANEMETKMLGNVWQLNAGWMKSSTDEIAFQHPATFPEKLASNHIKSWSNEGDLVYDPFMGSGTTGKMASLLKRKYIGSEISPEYTKLAEERINNYSNMLF